MSTILLLALSEYGLNFLDLNRWLDSLFASISQGNTHRYMLLQCNLLTTCLDLQASYGRLETLVLLFIYLFLMLGGVYLVKQIQKIFFPGKDTAPQSTSTQSTSANHAIPRSQPIPIAQSRRAISGINRTDVLHLNDIVLLLHIQTALLQVNRAQSASLSSIIDSEPENTCSLPNARLPIIASPQNSVCNYTSRRQ